MDFAQLPVAVRVQLAVVGPLLVGLVCGFVGQRHAIGFWVVQALGAVGGLAGGAEHPRARETALRGVLAGLLFGAGVAWAHALAGGPAAAPLPSPVGLIVPISGVGGLLLASAGGAVRRRG